ncbi:hypothetical protein Enr13x_40030 [Stieleria neptunia]|uniref:Uncharacterized protein n=1 Tax=Stieleria neptunia TaxID=2527979 RepID=A0A518HTJ0_9BACT|nr:hypothetical protein Enr13x_40030 [Stieleria neptunia]
MEHVGDGTDPLGDEDKPAAEGKQPSMKVEILRS